MKCVKHLLARILSAIALIAIASAPSQASDGYVAVDSVQAGGGSIAVSGGYIYVLGNSGVSKYSENLTQVSTWNASGWTLSANGHYVCVAGFMQLTWYSTEGSILAQAASVGGIVAVDVDGVAIARSWESDSLIAMLASDGHIIRRFFNYDDFPDDHFIDLARTPGGPVYAVDYFDGDASTRVSPLNLSLDGGGGFAGGGGFITQGGCSGPNNNTPVARAVGVDPGGNVYGVDGCNGNVEKHASTGGLLAIWRPRDGANDVAGDGQGNVYVINDYFLYKYAPSAPTPAKKMSWGQVKSLYR